MKVLYMGYAVHLDQMTRLSGVSVAGNKMQLNILTQLNNKVDELEIMTIYPISVWPKDKSVLVAKKKIDIGQNMQAVRVGFCNFPVIKQISQILSMYFTARHYLKKHPDAVIVTFNMYPQVGVPAVWLQKCGHKVIPILADLPIDDNYRRKGLGKFLRNLFDGSTRKSIKKADRVIVLNAHARDVFAPGKDFLVMEGGVTPEDYEKSAESIKVQDSGEKNIVYSGSLSEYSGVKELVDAMSLVDDPNVVLDIYGDGFLRDYVKSKCGSRIRFYGRVSNEQMLQKQREAWLLVNPRPIDDPIAQVTFPSKIFEYLMSGTPVLSTKLNGFSEEYQGIMYLAENNSPEELSGCITRIAGMEKEALSEQADRAREFVIREKSWNRQVERMVGFLEEIK